MVRQLTDRVRGNQAKRGKQLVSLYYGPLDTYIFNFGWTDPTVVLAIGVNF